MRVDRFLHGGVRIVGRAGKQFLIVLAICALLWFGMAQHSQPAQTATSPYSAQQLRDPYEYCPYCNTQAAMPPYSAQQLSMAGSAAAPTPNPAPGSGPTPSAAPTPIPTPAPQGGQSGTNNPNCSVGVPPLQVNLCQDFQVVIESSILDPVRTQAGDTWTQGAFAVFETDPQKTYADPDIMSLHATLLLAADSLLLLMLLFTGIRIVYEQNIASWSEFKESVPQVLFALLLAHLSLALVGALISLNNVLCTVLLPTAAPAINNLVQPVQNQNALNLFADFLNFVIGVFAIILIIEAIVRIPVLNLCAVVSALGCLLLVWKPTQKYGGLWLNTMLTATFSQFLQVLMLTVGAIMLKTLQTSNPTLVQLAGIAMLFIALALPFYLYRWAIQPIFTTARTTIGAGETVAEVGARTAITAAGAM